MTTALTLSTDRQDDGTTRLTAIGEIDLSNNETFTKALADATGDGTTTVVDLRDVTYLDSGAVTALFLYADHIHVVVNADLKPVLDISGLTQLVKVDVAQPSERAAEE
ncbi:STAS domain-containing protein [Kibdelosporangium lantanae]|uniref:STAS domain-containing protein n=1 Tax=Kibdelosporangium lantanae TaxID=1497396 RepID=A0ABW3MLP4_9PSEU